MRPICPNCGADATGGWWVCEDCGKVFCAKCDQNGKNQNMGNCPRCASQNVRTMTDFNDFKNIVKNSQN